jgi:hypothetical protein
MDAKQAATYFRQLHVSLYTVDEEESYVSLVLLVGLWNDLKMLGEWVTGEEDMLAGSQRLHIRNVWSLRFDLASICLVYCRVQSHLNCLFVCMAAYHPAIDYNHGLRILVFFVKPGLVYLGCFC